MFKKYNSIENSYRAKHILKALEWYPELKDCKYSIREKIDGSNLQLYFAPGQPMKVGKRSAFLSEGENFFDVWNTLKKYQKEIDAIQTEVENSGLPVRIFGELYGTGIQKRVDYGPDKYLAFFDVEVDGEMWSQHGFERLMEELGITNLAPLLGYANNLEEALGFNVDFDSKILGKENNPSEGIVIKPYYKDYKMGNGSRFLLKKKADSFAEKMNVKPGKKVQEEAARVIKAKSEFVSYINENRLQGIFSKHGEIQDMDQFGRYIQLLLADAKEDFLKDYDVVELSEKELKNVFKSGGKYAANLIKAHV